MPPSRPMRFMGRASHACAASPARDRLARVFGRLKEQPSPQSLVGATSTPATGDERKGPPEGLILILFAVLTLAASAFVLQRAEHKALHDPAQKAARGEVSGLSGLSFFRAENLRKV